MNLVIEWARLHQAELEENWRLARLNGSMKRIEGLE